MIQGFYTATTGAIEHQKMLDIAANNISNANNDSYKTSNISFQELLYQRMRMPNDYESNQNNYDTWVARNKGQTPVPADQLTDDQIAANNANYFAENKLRSGAGARVSEAGLVMTQGAAKDTTDPLSAMIKGDAFFAVEDKDGNITYTREGDFNLSLENDGLYLVLPNGEYVLDENYDRITIPDNVNKDDINLVSPSYAGDDPTDIKLGLFTCNNIYGLSRISEDQYVPTDFSGGMVAETRPGVDIVNHAAEMSNVSIADEMVKIIEAQRAWESNLTVIRTADEIEAYANQMRT
ncbi:MAG: flagellar hook-basal body complex protein [Oscillospiraceae bacterium]|nr:flagellar hook-basal body complex protein [Oscillospiraceae bacterium]